jgi:hypothetical protein
MRLAEVSTVDRTSPTNHPCPFCVPSTPAGYEPILRTSASVGQTPNKFGQILTEDLEPIYIPGEVGRRADLAHSPG